MAYWIDEESESGNVIVTNDRTIFVGSCDKEAYDKVGQQLANGDDPVEVLGTDDVTAIPFSKIQNVTSRDTDKDVDVRYQAKKDIEDKTIYFDSIEKKNDFIANVDQCLSEHLDKSESKQSIVTAAISPLLSLILSLSTAYLFLDKFRWPAIIVGGIWALASLYMLVTRAKNPPTITRWSISGRHFRKMWSGLKTGFSYVVLALIVIAVYGRFPDAYGHKSIYEQLNDESLTPAEVEVLLERGADIDYKGEDGSTALALALSWGEDDIAIALIELGADLSIKDGEESPLEYAVNNGSKIVVIEAMLRSGASLDFDIEGVTPLDYSKQTQDIELERLISKYSYDLKVKAE